jgi:hypothetical protein
MSKKKQVKPEDLLIDEELNLSNLTEHSDSNNNADHQNKLIALQIYSFLHSGRRTTSEAEINQTKKRISNSVQKSKLKRIIIRLSVAASLLIIFVLGGIWYAQMNQTSEISDFAKSTSISIPETETLLILQDGQKVTIDKKESEISYTPNGQQITIGKGQQIIHNNGSVKQNFNTVIVPYGRRSFITLSEGTKVWLNSGSKFIYPAVFAANIREVYIEGEAVFDVSHFDENPFYVRTRDFDIKVLGTVFNVSAYADEKTSSTVLAKGKIELCVNDKSMKNNNRQIIKPGTMAEFDPDSKSFTCQTVNPDEYLSWHDGYLIFKHENLVNILKKITRYYNVEIDVETPLLREETFSGYLDLKNTPEQVLDVISQTTPFVYKYEVNKIVLTSKN